MDSRRLFLLVLLGLLMYNAYYALYGHKSNEDALRQEFNDSIARARKAIEDYFESKLRAVTSQVEELDNDFTRAEIESLKSRFKMLNDKITNYKSHLNKLDELIDIHEEAMLQLDEESEMQSDELELLRDQIQSLKQTVEQKAPVVKVEATPVPKPADIALQRWYQEWRDLGFKVVPPIHETVTIYVSSSNDIVSNFILTTGAWDITKLRDIIEILSNMPSSFNKKDSSTIPFVDIGANLGWFTLSVAAWGFRVHSFEPMPFNNELLAMSFKENEEDILQRITHHEIGLDKTARECYIVSHRDNANDGISFCGANKAEVDEQLKHVQEGYSYRGSSKSNTLDAELPGKDIYLLKIDVEGYEESVLTRGGATTLFTKHKVHYIISEVSTSINVISYLKFFRDLGYTISTETFEGPVVPSDISKEEFHQLYGGLTDVFMTKQQSTVKKAQTNSKRKDPLI